jgi:hypothetical protein
MKQYLVERNVEVKNLTCDEFVKMMSEDMQTAVDLYQTMIDKRNEEVERETTERNLTRFYNEAEKLFAKFKRESTRKRKTEAYVDEMMATKNTFWKLRGLTFFDIDCEPGKNGISSSCCISVDKMMSILPNTFEYLKDNKYFNGAIGWKLGYEGSYNDERFCSGRPEIYLTLPVELEIQYKAEAKALADDIMNFYATTRYCGD